MNFFIHDGLAGFHRECQMRSQLLWSQSLRCFHDWYLNVNVYTISTMPSLTPNIHRRCSRYRACQTYRFKMSYVRMCLFFQRTIRCSCTSQSRYMIINWRNIKLVSLFRTAFHNNHSLQLMMIAHEQVANISVELPRQTRPIALQGS